MFINHIFQEKSNSEKYLVCKNFKFETKEIENKLKNMEQLLESMDTTSPSIHPLFV